MIDSRYNLEAFARALKDPRRLAGELRYVSQQINAKLTSSDVSGSHRYMNADWDVMILLDGCRFDLFSEESTLPGETSSILSAGSNSVEFMQAYFHGQQLHDTVYVTANPHADKIDPETFHDIKFLYNTHWDDDVGTILPQDVYEQTVATARMYPNKRVIAHFMQPHHPFLGETGRSFDSGHIDFTGDDVWTTLRNFRCPVDETTVWKAYRENYNIAEEYIKNIHQEITGKIIVTSDHGNLIGERLFPIPVRGYGHPGEIRHPALLKVPWHQLPFEERRKTQASPPVSTLQNSSDTDIDKRLHALGYK